LLLAVVSECWLLPGWRGWNDPSPVPHNQNNLVKKWTGRPIFFHKSKIDVTCLTVLNGVSTLVKRLALPDVEGLLNVRFTDVTVNCGGGDIS
jgi:hypothetical protein